MEKSASDGADKTAAKAKESKESKDSKKDAAAKPASSSDKA
jgi:hypothetical protein